MRAVSDAHGARPCRSRHLQVVRGVPDHQDSLRLDTKFNAELEQHRGMRLRCRLVGAAGRREQRTKLRHMERTRQARPALAGCDRERLRTAEPTKQLAYACKELQRLLVG